MTQYNRIIMAVIGSTLLAIPLSANAPRQDSPCKNDIQTFCGDHKGNRKAMRVCIKANASKFSDECKAAKNKHQQGRLERKAKLAKILDTCNGDVQQLCAKESKKQNLAIRCLMKNRAKVSETCKAVLPQPRVRKQK